jgi:N-acetylglutamate synthase-like GNAT family acetyltransferase
MLEKARALPTYSAGNDITHMSARIAIEQPTDSDIDTIHGVLKDTYWSPGIPRDVVARAAANSMCAIARDDHGKLIGYARLVTDKATFAWLCDVIVLPGKQGRGLGRALVGAFRQHADLQGLRRWLLGTKDAHGVYAPLGFKPMDNPGRFMEIRNPAPYGRATS